MIKEDKIFWLKSEYATYKEKPFYSEMNEEILSSFGIIKHCSKNNSNNTFKYIKSIEYFKSSIKNLENFKKEVDFDRNLLLKQYKASLKNLIEAERKIEELKKIIPNMNKEALEKISQLKIKEKYKCIKHKGNYSHKDVYLLSFDIFHIDFYREDTGFMRNQLVLSEKSLTFKTGGKSFDLFKIYSEELN